MPKRKNIIGENKQIANGAKNYNAVQITPPCLADCIGASSARWADRMCSARKGFFLGGEHGHNPKESKVPL